MRYKFFILFFLAALGPVTACTRLTPPPIGLYGIMSQEGVEYVHRGERPLVMDIYRPRNAPGPHPGIVMFHGGGWVAGDRTQLTPMARYLASIGYTAATVQYRLADNGGQYPASVCDALAAVKFLRKNATEYAVDPNRIGAIGYSAGAELALLVGLAKDPSIFGDDSYPGVSPSIQSVVDISGPTDLSNVDAGGVVVQYMLEKYLGWPPEKYAERYAQSSPVTHVRSDAPPILILHGDRDNVVGFRQAELLAEELRRVHATHELVCIPKGTHIWNFPFGSPLSLRALPIMTRFLTRYLDATPTPPSTSP